MDTVSKRKTTGQVIDLMAALKESLANYTPPRCECDRDANHRGDDDVMRCAKCHYEHAFPSEGEP